MDEVMRAMEERARQEAGAAERAVQALHREAVRAIEFMTDGVATRADAQNMRADARAVVNAADVVLGTTVDHPTPQGASQTSGRKAAVEFGRAALMVMTLMGDGQMMPEDVQYVRVSARRALGAAQRADSNRAAPRTEKPRPAFDVLVEELAALRERSLALSTTVGGNASERMARGALIEARVEALVNLALNLLTGDEFAALVRAVGLESYTA